MTKADIERLGTGMTAAMAQVQEQMKNLPSAQRAQIEAAMGTAPVDPKTLGFAAADFQITQ